jgi:alpha-galactosidase
VLDLARSLPRIVHWGADLGELSDPQLQQLVLGSYRQTVANQPDRTPWVSVLPENSQGWVGTPGLEGHRGGRHFSTQFATTGIRRDTDPDGTERVTTQAADAVAGLGLELSLELLPSGLARLRVGLTNLAADPYTLNGLLLAWPLPQQAQEVLDFTGKHGRERAPQRHPLTHGTYLREGRHGRTGTDATLLLLAGEAGFGFRQGAVWGIHAAWSGNHRMLVERGSGTETILAGGELLLPGEIELGPGETYASPWLYASYGQGLDELSARFHHFVRATRPPEIRPVTGNCWEAVYFDHRLDRLTELADAFAEVGVERFVLDDGWFRHRRDDHAGLGDWYVDETVWPGGLHPLVDHVRGLGLEFGLWVEPEMINVDSDLARAHPEWILAPGDRLPLEWRHQQVLNVGHPAAWSYLFERLDALITEYDLTYLKWDHNRDLLEPGSQLTGRAGVHAQTLAVYRLIDELKAAHPRLQIESCSAGGGRADLAILGRTDRVWTSDCTDAHERQVIQRYTGLIIPPELLGAHISADPNHQTWRRLTLAMRAATAMFGDLGVEWNVARLDADERRELAEWIATYKQWRPLLHGGTVVRLDHPDPAVCAHGVVAADGHAGLFLVTLAETSVYGPPGLLRLGGLSPHASYRLEPLPATRRVVAAWPGTPPPWWEPGLTLSGQGLMQYGFQLPDVPPDTPLLFAVTRVDGGPGRRPTSDTTINKGELP